MEDTKDRHVGGFVCDDTDLWNTKVLGLVQFLMKVYLTEIHHNALVDLLPQVSPEDLDEGDLQSGDLAVHEDASQIQLHLETHVHLQERKNE